jgi:hypothetical protein
MTVYTTVAIATNAIGNTVTVASADNMVSGMPITFSGNVFGDIISGATYYIGNIAFGYPTSTITLTSLPGVGQYALATDTGSMTGTFSSGGQQIIPTTSPGVPLGTAFTYVNTNFDQVFAAGPVGSNVQIKNNTIYTLDTNGNLILNPNGIGNVTANASINPAQDRVWSLGSPTLRWQNIYAEYGEIGNANISSITIPVGNLHILGGNSNNVLQTDGAGNLSWTVPLALAGGDFNYSIQYNDNGVLNGSSSFTFDNSSNTVYIGNLVTDISNLNDPGNIHISGGQAGFVLQTDGTGNLSWVAPIGNTQQILDQQIVGDNVSLAYDLIMPAFSNTVIVSINGVLQLPNTAYVVSNQTIVFSEPLLESEVADVRFLVGGPSGNNHPNGANGSIQFNSGDGFGGTANLTYNATTGNLYSTNVVVSGNITASYYYGDGSQLSNIKATANTGNITFANNVISTANGGNSINITGPQQTPVVMATGGNSATSQLLWSTNIGSLTPANTFNAVITGNTLGSQISAGNTGVVIASNSAAGLQTWTFANNGTLSSTGGILAGNVTAAGNVVANVNLSAVGNIVGTYIFANAAFMTGIPLLYGNSNVANYLNGYIGNVIPVANLSYSLGNSTRRWQELWVSNVHASGNITGANTVSARFFVGDGSGLINLPTNNTVPAGSNTQVQFNNSGAFGGSPGFTFNKTSNTLSVTGNVTGGNIVTAGIISATGNIQGQYILGNGAFLTGIAGGGNANTGNVTFDNINIIGTGNLHLQPDPANSGSYLDIFLTSGPDLHLVASANANLILGQDAGANIMTSYDGNVYIQSWNGINANIWTFGADGELTTPQGGRLGSAGKGWQGLDGGNGNPVSFTSFFANGNYAGCLTAYPDGTLNITTYGDGTGQLGQWNFANAVLTFPDTGLIDDNGGILRVKSPANTGVQLGSSDDQNYVTVSTGNVVIQTQADTDNYNWTFDNTGNLTAPGNIQMSNISGIYSSTAGYVVGLRMSNTEPSVKLVANNHEWRFDSNGVLKFPTPFSPLYPAITMTQSANLLIQGYQGVGYAEDGGNIIVSGGVSDSGNNGNATVFGQQVTVQTQLSAGNGSPTYNWIFDTTGNLTAPGDISATGNVYASNLVAEAPFEIRVYDFAANIGGRYGVNTQTNTVTATLPASPPVGGAVFFADAAGAYNILNLIIDPNGQTIMGATGNMTVSTNNQSVGLFWNGSTWRIYNAG